MSTRLIPLLRPAIAITIAAALPACGSSATPTAGPGAGEGASDVVDQDFQYDEVQVEGTRFSPEGLDRPDMLLARPARKTTLDKQRTAYRKAKPEARDDEAVVLATMLYEAGQKERDQGRRTALLEEARGVLADSEAAAEPRSRAVLLHNYACLSHELGDQAGMIEGLRKAVEAAPDEPLAGERRAYLAYYLVRAGKSGDAAAAVAPLEPSAAAPEQAYAIAWAAFHTRDHGRARTAMRAAAQGWKAKYFLPALRRDVALFAARTGASVDEAIEMARAYAEHVKGDAKGGEAGALFEMLALVHQAYTRAGRPAEASALADRMLKVKEPSPIELVGLRLEQAEAAKVIGQPDDLLARVRDAQQAVAACGEPCQTESVPRLIFGHARFAANLYATSGDERWYPTARGLYGIYLELPALPAPGAGKPGFPDAPTAQSELAEFEQTRQSLVAGKAKEAGKYDKGVTWYVLEPRWPEIAACYDEVLQAEPKLAGALALRLELNQAGEVTGVSAEPPAGEAGLAAVATCAIGKARGWWLPARLRPGVTRIAVAYGLRPSSPAR
jgi:hypothetical protein